MIQVAGVNVSRNFEAILENLTVTDKAGTSSDTASITLDDSGGQISMPRIGDPISIFLGWADSGVSLVFQGTVDSVRSVGARGGGRKLTITAKGFDPKGKAKEPLEFHKDDATLQEFMSEAAGKAGLSFQAQGQIGQIKREYWAATTESFLHLGRRIATEVGAEFKIAGNKAIMYPKNSGQSVSGMQMPTVIAAVGGDLIEWDVSPMYARPRYAKARVRYYDTNAAKWKEKSVEITPQGATSDAIHTHRQTRADEDEAGSAADENKRSSERERGGGSITIFGNPFAKPEGTCTLMGTRPGIDGSYKIDLVEHTLSRGAGYETRLDLKHPEGDVGSDDRE
jgi:hypothetical protein